MPIPSPRGQEEHDAFIDRCMEEIGDEYDDNDQAVAVCEDQWEEAKKQVAPTSVIDEWPKPSEDEDFDSFIARCIPTLIENENMPQPTAEVRCVAIWNMVVNVEDNMRGFDWFKVFNND